MERYQRDRAGLLFVGVRSRAGKALTRYFMGPLRARTTERGALHVVSWLRCLAVPCKTASSRTPSVRSRGVQIIQTLSPVTSIFGHPMKSSYRMELRYRYSFHHPKFASRNRANKPLYESISQPPARFGGTVTV